MGISSPVLGLRPGRGFFWRREKLPKPETFTCSPSANAPRILSKNISTNSFASRLFRPSSLNRFSARSALVSAIGRYLLFLIAGGTLLTRLGAQPPFQGGHNLRHQLLHIVLIKSARRVLQGQAQGQTFSSGINAFPSIFIK